jgi:hypothetical protein
LVLAVQPALMAETLGVTVFLPAWVCITVLAVVAGRAQHKQLPGTTAEAAAAVEATTQRLAGLVRQGREILAAQDQPDRVLLGLAVAAVRMLTAALELQLMAAMVAQVKRRR